MNNDPVLSALTPSDSFPAAANAAAEENLLRRYLAEEVRITDSHRMQLRDVSDEPGYSLSGPMKKILTDWLNTDVAHSDVTPGARAYACFSVNDALERGGSMPSSGRRPGCSPSDLRFHCEEAIRTLERGTLLSEPIRAALDAFAGVPPTPAAKLTLEQQEIDQAKKLLGALTVMLEFRSALWDASRSGKGGSEFPFGGTTLPSGGGR